MLRIRILSLLTVVFVLVALGVASYFLFEERPTQAVTIGIVIPMEHVALQEIVAGFQQALRSHFSEPVTFNVQNAQGDVKLQRGIIELFLGHKVDMIVPVGTQTSLMALSLVKETPVVTLAAVYPESERQKRVPRNVTGVLDEIDPKKKIELIKEVYPDLKKFTLIFNSTNEKNFPEVETLVNYGKTKGIEVQKITIQTLPELQAASHQVATDSEAIVLLKDHLLASGIRMLVPIAKNKGLPLITSDEGTVQEGATFALGVGERAIGEAGGKLAAKVLQGEPIEQLPMESIEALTLFYNPTALQSIHLPVDTLKKLAERHHYHLSAVQK